MRQAWGKTDREGGTDRTHPLAHHSMDVAAVFLRLLRLPVVRNRLEAAAKAELTEVDCQRLAALAFLHDIGKLHPGFQAKGWPVELQLGKVQGHTKESWEFFVLAHKWPKQHPFHATLLSVLEWGPHAVSSLLAAMFAHHGRPVLQPTSPTLRSWDLPRTPHYAWQSEADQMGKALVKWFEGAFVTGAPQLSDNPQFHHMVAGFAALADWIGSNVEFFPFSEPFSPDYHVDAHKNAQRALSRIGFDIGDLAKVQAPGFHQLTGYSVPNPAQATVDEVDSEARLVILEAETGAGKTEAALWRFTKLLAAGKVSGLYFAVPTRAAAKQLHERINKALRQAFGKAAPEAVLAIPGMLKAGEFEGQRLPHWRVQWNDSDTSVPHRWAAEHATRFLAASVAVGTVDQALLAGLQVKHAHLRGSALSRSLLVVDEVHASDAYMTEVLKRLLDGHLAGGGFAMLMSATLGSKARVRWTGETQPDPIAAAESPYPAIWIQGEPRPRPTAGTGKSKAVHLNAVPTMEPMAAAKLAIQAAKRGARVLVIRNMVRTAVETWRTVEQLEAGFLLMQVGRGPAVHHSRFAAEDRTLLDRAVEAALSPDPNRKSRGCIVIGTQTLEQSLDIDADILITDLCPIDVLLQRIGRLHRHELARPDGFTECRAHILLPEDGLDPLAKPKFVNGLGGWKSKDGGFNGIYTDLAGLELTRRLIAQRGLWRIPEMNRELVESATHPDCLASLIAEKGADWERYDRDIGGTEAAKVMIAHLNALDREKPYASLRFPDSDERIMTRLGEEGVILSLPDALTGPFGSPITRIALPAHWSRGIAKEALSKVALQDQSSTEIEVGDQVFLYSRAGLEKKTCNRT